MLRLLLAIALLALTLLAAMVAGAAMAIVTGIVSLNVFAVALGLRSWARRSEPASRERWRPSSFRLPPEPPYESDDEHAPPLTVHRR